MNNLVLDVKNLTKKFGSSDGEFTAVDNLSFSIADGEILGLLGQNGAGKTTTIQMLLGVMQPTLGDISYFGKNFYKNREEILQMINYSSTYISLPWFFTVSEILEIFSRLYDVPDRKKRIQKLLQEFEVDHLIKKQFYMLSAGEKTRLLLVKAFLNYPKLILLDEPTASLDPDIAVKIREFLKKEKQEYNVSMLFTSHNMTEVEEMCDKVIFLKHGKLIAQDTPENLAKNMSECIVDLMIFQDSKKAIELLDKKGFSYKKEKYQFKITLDEKEVASLLMLFANAKIEYRDININKPSLEDYFLDVVKKEDK